MTGKFLQTEEGAALLIPPQALEEAGLSTEDDVTVSVVNRSVVIEAQAEAEHDPEMQKIFQRLLRSGPKFTKR